MLRKSKFYVINFMDPRIIFFTKKILTLCAMKTHIQKSYKESKWEGKKIVCKDCKWIRTNLLLMLRYIFYFIKYSSMLNATFVTNAFLCCICFFSDDVLGKHVDPSCTSIIFDSPVSV